MLPDALPMSHFKAPMTSSRLLDIIDPHPPFIPILMDADLTLLAYVITLRALIFNMVQQPSLYFFEFVF